MAAERILGIDLGTTNSLAACFVEGAVLRIPNVHGETLTPSVVALDKRDGSLVVGRPAKDLLALDASCGAAVFKRGMGTDLSFPLGGTRYGAVELSALVLRSLKEDAERELAMPVERAVITVPAYFDEAQRHATMKAGELAGLEVVRILNEPTAAAIAFGLHARESDATLVVVDLGGGTFDVCVMDRFEGVLEVRSVAGESVLGGEDFTRRLAALALQKAGGSYEQAEMRDHAGLGLLLKRSELAKRVLGPGRAATIRVPALKGVLAAEREVEIAPEDAEAAWGGLLERLVGPCQAALRGASLTRHDVDELVLVGGATRMPWVQKSFREFFGKEPASGVDPDHAVVHGAAIQAALCAAQADVGDLVVTDVASHSLGVETSRLIGTTRVPGYFSPLIHRNTVIPVSRSDVFSTIDHDQQRMTLRVYEGESRYVKENRAIGSVDVRGIPKGPPGKDVKVTFTFDLNGLLEVEAEVVETGEKVSKVFHRLHGALDEAAMEAARKRLARFKRDPRENDVVREAMARGELLLREVAPVLREELERALDWVEQAVESRDPQRIHEAVGHLRKLCEQIDRNERW